MNTVKQINYLVVFTLAVLMLLAGVAQASTVTFGVQAPRGNAKALKKWGELGNYLSAAIGQPVKIVPLKPNKTVDAVNEGKAQFMLSNPVLAVALKEKNGSAVLATMTKKSGPKFGGVIIAKKGNGITKASDLKGKKVMAYKFKKSAAAYVFQVKHLKDQGINPHTDFKSFKEAKKQDDIVLAVHKGIMDAGFIKTGLLEAMAEEGKVSMDDFVIIDKQSSDFIHIHSTELYPAWTVTVLPSVDPAVTEKVKTALMKLSANDKAAKSAKIKGFVEPESLDDLANTLQELQLPPFK